MNVLLVGNPNVGKSVLFSRLTGARVIASNYPGSTVSMMSGRLHQQGIDARLIDAPGTYTLQPTNKAEEVATRLVQDADIVINVVDATSLERNLSLTMDLIETIKKPLVVALSMWDETRHRGIEIDVLHLERLLGVKVVPVCGLTGEGIKDLISAVKKAAPPTLKFPAREKWCVIGSILEKVQKLYHRHHTFRDLLIEASIRPPWAYGIAVLAVAACFRVITFIGEGLINYVCDPLFQRFYTPLIMKLSSLLHSGGAFFAFLHDVLIGNLAAGEIDYSLSFGLLTTGLYVPLAMVLPYVLSFYFVLGILEDLGYLPRLAVLTDRLFHRLGLHGYAIVPTVLGLGCNVPGALSIRLFEERREKFIAATLLAIAIPCMAQTAMIIGILGRFGGQYVAIVFTALFLVWLTMGSLLNRFLKGESPEILLEIPPYRRPVWHALLKKLWLRIHWFILEAVPFVLLGVGIVNLLYFSQVIDVFSRLVSPLVENVWGLPRSAVGALIVGFLRKDVAVGMLRPMGLSLRQLIVGSTVLAVYFPCVATFIVLIRELGVKDMLKSTLLMLLTAVIVGGLLNFILTLAGIG